MDAQLLLYGFGPDAEFEGRLVGALERLESGGTLRVLDALFLRRDGASGELEAIDLRGRGRGGFTAPLLGFRLDAAERRRATAQALDGEPGAGSGKTLRDLGAALEPGAALAAVLVEHVWADALEDAVSRTGGSPLLSEFVAASALSELLPELDAAARARP